jgi:phage-related protein
VKQIEWSEESLDDLVALDKGIARRIKTAVERFAETGTRQPQETTGH